MVDIVEDRGDQILDTAKDSPAQSIFGQVAEKALHHVQLTCTPESAQKQLEFRIQEKSVWAGAGIQRRRSSLR